MAVLYFYPPGVSLVPVDPSLVARHGGLVVGYGAVGWERRRVLWSDGTVSEASIPYLREFYVPVSVESNVE